MSKKVATTIGRHCDELAGAKGANISPAPDALAWAAGTEGKIRARLVAWGLAEPISPKLLTDAGRYVGAFADSYIDGRTDIAPNTRRNFGQAKKLLVEYFGERHPLQSITSADAERWRRWLLARVVKAKTDDAPAEMMAKATVSMYVRKIKTMFNEAVRDRLLPESPFALLKAGNDSNPERLRFIDRATALRVIDACPDADWRALFSLARFAGMRCPSEVLSIKWTDVDWAAGRLRIDSPKTGLRFCPLFPELRTVLGEAMEAAPDGAVYCVGRHHGGGVNLRTQLGRILNAAGEKPWPKLFQNLRSSRRTELQEIYPSHVINAWLGQSTKVAEDHYLQVTDEHWGRAVESRPLAGPLISNGAESITNNHGTKESLENKAADGSSVLVMDAKIPPARIELTTRL